ncbi:sulfurtransferase [uncultured Muriicola sp.]|uniref:sulfurtransferase n=1 Tax=uncultured Muriicola sp. TaxID=1583102 RepID=UPI00261BC28F|nr:sulfurtransferase [uncultured Muriicola sp.]
MILRNSLLLIMLATALISCKENSKLPPQEEVLLNSHLVSYDSPLLNSTDATIGIIDFRSQEAYDKGHLPGAINLYRNDFQDTTLPYKGMRINKSLMAEQLGKVGITEKATLVVYDDKGSSDASRLWWLLHLYNFEQVYLLDGGIGHWEKMGGTISRNKPKINPTIFRFTDQPDKPVLITKENLLRLIKSDASRAILVDARSKEEYEGRYLKAGAKKAGRIPKSINIDWAEAVDYGNTYTFKPLAELEKIYGRIAASREDTIIVYCHTGVRSSHTTFVLTQLLDYKNVLNYDGSWVEWSYNDDLPFETESITIVKN